MREILYKIQSIIASFNVFTTAYRRIKANLQNPIYFLITNQNYIIIVISMFRSQGYFFLKSLIPWADPRLPRHVPLMLAEQSESSMARVDFTYMAMLLHNFKLQEPKGEQSPSLKNTFRRNFLDNRILKQQLAANYPVEDFVCSHQLRNCGGYLMAVFDGHGGPDLAEFSSSNIADYFEKAFLKCQQPKDNVSSRFEAALYQAYDSLETECLKVVRKGIETGNRKLKNSGTCALTVVVSDNTVYVANAGDSQGIIITEDGENMSCIKLNKKFNASSKKQQARLKSQFSQPDIIIHHPNNPNAVYIKGRLQTTRCIGDYYLKSEQFNYSPKIPNFSGPYITHKPDIKIFPLNPESKFIVIASDGLWDQMTRFEVTKLVLTSSEEDKAQLLIDKCLEKIAAKHKLSLEQIKELPNGQKRAYHDDISVMVINLTQQYEQKKTD